MNRAYVGLGSNLGDSRQLVLDAMDALENLPGARPVGRSRLYRTPPWGLLEQPPFINAAMAVETPMAPLELLDAMLAIERAAGRIRDGERWGPRTLDLDLLHVEGFVLHDPRLTLPHPRIAERAFVLLPLNELAPDLELADQGRIAEMLAAVDSSQCQLLP
ncbi:MAG TPA: 2-amino-4-hydroxy-6-hydroxymethyldihydropteridine diphosphokinase [Dyella sp.]|uniref:2-amino-4-hydroxy-6- hydroxymethyldihydropteridine diphosphokinase n=1 Tax=Dyella sp. TaxID=1869338 RepID=UPI002F93D81A